MHSHNIHSLATINYPTSPRRNSPTHSSHLNIQKVSSLLFHQQARKSSAPENIQRLFRLQNCRSRKSSISWKFSKNNQQQQSTAAISTSNQQQQSTAAISSSNQQQQPAAATSSSNQHSSYQQHLRKQRRPPLVINTVHSRGYPASS